MGRRAAPKGYNDFSLLRQRASIAVKDTAAVAVEKRLLRILALIRRLRVSRFSKGQQQPPSSDMAAGK